MVTSQQLLPPSGRDFEVYRCVMVERWSTRLTAREAGVSQTRVCQIVKRVDEFLKGTTPGTNESEECRRQNLWVAEHLAAARADEIHGEMMRAFRASVNPRAGKLGETRYIMAALRAAAVGAKLPSTCIALGNGFEEDEAPVGRASQPVEEVVDEHDGLGSPSYQETSHEEPISPPVGDCSPVTEKTEVTAETQAENSVASPVMDIVSEALQVLNRAPKFAAARPVQNEDSRQQQTSEKKLNRKQRRARMQFLQSAEGS